MNNSKTFSVITALALTTLAPATLQAEGNLDDLDATMVVLDNTGDLALTINMIGDPDTAARVKSADSEPDSKDTPYRLDEFDLDYDHEEDELENEDDFEEGEDLDEVR